MGKKAQELGLSPGPKEGCRASLALWSLSGGVMAAQLYPQSGNSRTLRAQAGPYLCREKGSLW